MFILFYPWYDPILFSTWGVSQPLYVCLSYSIHGMTLYYLVPGGVSRPLYVCLSYSIHGMTLYYLVPGV